MAPRPRIKIIRAYAKLRRLSWAKEKLISQIVAPRRNSTPIEVRLGDIVRYVLYPGDQVELTSVVRKISVRMTSDKK